MLAGNPDGLFVDEADDDSHCKVCIKDNGTTFCLKVEHEELAVLAAVLLEAAVRAYQRTGKPLSDSTAEAILCPTIIPTKLAFGPSDIPGCQSIVLRFGETALGLAIPTEQLTGLGQAILAFGVGGVAH